MSKTREQIQFKALAIIVGGDVGTAPAAEDVNTIDGYIDDVVAELNADKVTFIADPNELDDVLFVTFCKLVANAAAEEFGGQSDEKAALSWRNRIRVLSAQTPGFGPQQAIYF